MKKTRKNSTKNSTKKAGNTKSTAAGWRTRARAKSGQSRGRAAAGPSVAEIALAFTVKRSPEAMETLATVLGKTPGAVESIWRAIDGDQNESPPTAQLRKQVEHVREALGNSNRGQIELRNCLDSPERKPASECSTSCESTISYDREHSGYFTFQ